MIPASSPAVGPPASMLTVLDHLPPGLLERPASELHAELGGPTLIHLPGERTPALFVSVLLHGNETTGWEALRQLLAQWDGRPLPRALSVLVGNVEAAREGLRHLDHQPDYNRIWRGGPWPEAGVAARVLEEMRARGVWCALDVHNTSGRNPHYACIHDLEPVTLALAARFSHVAILATTPETVLSRAFEALGPAITVECGLPGQPYGVNHARAFLEECLVATTLPGEGAPDTLLRTAAVVRVPWETRLGFGDPGAVLDLATDVDRLNFRDVPAGTVLGTIRAGDSLPLHALDPSGVDVTARHLRRDGDHLVAAADLLPAMLTTDVRIVHQDCLCYLMERVPHPARRAPAANAEMAGGG